MSRTGQPADVAATDAYFREGERLAYALGNRGPLRFEADGSLSRQIRDAYARCGFYVFEEVLSAAELADLRADLDQLLARAPYTKDAQVDARGRPALGTDLVRPSFHFARPLSDPVGGTTLHNGRHPAKMAEPTPPADAPDYVIAAVSSPLHLLDSCLRLYGHPQLLAAAAEVNGADFVPFSESIIVKPAGLGASVAWHQDGTQRWAAPEWDEGTHGFNFMAQLFGSTAANGVWVLPGSHQEGKVDIKALVEANGGSDRLPGAVPMVCRPGDVVISNRQALHGSFANTSPDLRVTVNFGFHRRAAVLGVRARYGERELVYDQEFIYQRSRLIALAIDARQQRYPHEPRYHYQPLAGQEEENRWNEANRERILKNYNLRDLNI